MQILKTSKEKEKEPNEHQTYQQQHYCKRQWSNILGTEGKKTLDKDVSKCSIIKCSGACKIH